MPVTRTASHTPTGGGQERAGSGQTRDAAAVIVRSVQRWLQQAGRAFGVKRTTQGVGVVYRERSGESLARALGKNGRGYKVFEAVFADGSRQVIRATATRVYADLARPARLARYQRLEGLVRPGMRVLEIGCSTGYGTAWLAGRVGVSGAVVAVDDDEEAVRFAAKRYPLATVSFEVRREDSLSGEVDGAFGAVVWLGSGPTPTPSIHATVLWRIIAPGGWMVLTLPESGGERDAFAASLRGLQAVEPVGAARGGMVDVLFGKVAQSGVNDGPAPA